MGPESTNASIKVAVRIKEEDKRVINAVYDVINDRKLRDVILQAVFEAEVCILANQINFSMLPYANGILADKDYDESGYSVELGSFTCGGQLARMISYIENFYCGASYGTDTIEKLVYLGIMNYCNQLLFNRDNYYPDFMQMKPVKNLDELIEGLLDAKDTTGFNADRKLEFFSACGKLGLVTESEHNVKYFIKWGRQLYILEKIGMIQSREAVQPRLLMAYSSNNVLEAKSVIEETIYNNATLTNYELIELVSITLNSKQ